MNQPASDIVPVVAIDGPVGSGKGTIAARLASRLGWHLLDSGALYRLVAIAAMDSNTDAEDEDALSRIAHALEFRFEQTPGGSVPILSGVNVAGRIRKVAVSAMASKVAAVPSVRAAMVDRQRAFAQPPGLVADGRDMGTVIFPQAVLKIFLTASVEERAQRRYKQLKDKGESVNLSRLFSDIKARDARDTQRAIAPLRAAEDAVTIDSTENSIDEVLNRIYFLLEEREIDTCFK